MQWGEALHICSTIIHSKRNIHSLARSDPLRSGGKTLSLLLLHYHYNIFTFSLHYRYIIIALSLHYRYIIITLYLHYVYIIFTLSLHYLYFMTLSLHYHCIIISFFKNVFFMKTVSSDEFKMQSPSSLEIICKSWSLKISKDEEAKMADWRERCNFGSCVEIAWNR